MISVIIPTLNESKSIGGLLCDLRGLDGSYEVVFSDGGSSDCTLELVRQAGSVVSCGRGRAAQMNEGARNAKGDIFFFVHSDCRIAGDTLSQIKKAVDDGFVGGCLTLYSGQGFKNKVVDSLGAVNARIFREYFGDHGIFVTKKAFEDVGGFPDIPIMEDVAFSKNLRSYGRTTQLRVRIHASTRRFERGYLRTLLFMFALRALYAVGVSPSRLKKYYVDVR